MSRAKATEVKSPLSLFPFIGVLLSTMGALLVVLIAVSQSAREAAVRDVAAEQKAAKKTPAAPAVDEGQAKLDQIKQYTARLRQLRGETERRLREDQLRLSGVEEQMRRLEDQMASLSALNAELEEMDQGHLDDRRQAEREIERRKKLIAESRTTIESLKTERATKKRSYAIIPYDGPNGTQRRPLYIECRADEVLLQPEGIRLTEQDFMPPIDSGNPLASALRAAREEIAKETGRVATKQTEPYPLILVRPDGVEAYYAVRQAIASWDADFGYEFVGNDWKLDFPPASPQLAKLESQAIEQARIRRQVLAAAAPRAYRAGGGFGGFRGDWDADEEELDGDWAGGGSGSGSGRGGGGMPAGGSSAPAPGYAAAPRGAGGGYPAVRTQQAGGSGPATGATGLASSVRGNQRKTSGGGAASGGNGAKDGASSGTSSANAVPSDVVGAAEQGSRIASAGDESAGSTGASSPPAGGTADSSAVPPPGAVAAAGPAPNGAGWNVTNSAGPASSVAAPPNAGGLGPAPSSAGSMPTLAPSQVHELQAAITSDDLAQARGANWAVTNRGRAVPVRRSIQVVVREDRVAILPDSAENDQATGGQEISVTGPMHTHIDEIVTAIQTHVNEWGIAGNGLYWRPVLVLHVAPEAQPRARELAQLLKDSGIELRTNTASGPAPDTGRR